MLGRSIDIFLLYGGDQLLTQGKLSEDTRDKIKTNNEVFFLYVW